MLDLIQTANLAMSTQPGPTVTELAGPSWVVFGPGLLGQPQKMQVGSRSSSLSRSSTRFDGASVVDVEAEVAVAPVEGPRLFGDGVSQPGDREAGPLRAEVLAPGSAPLDDGEVSRGDLTFDADLVAGVLGHSSGAPALHSCDVGVW